MEQVLILFAVLFSGYAFGARLLLRRNKFLATLFGLLAVLATQSVLQTAWYYTGGLLNGWSDLWTLVGTIAMLWIVTRFTCQKRRTETESPPPKNLAIDPHPLKKFLMLIPLLIGLTASVFVLRQAFAAATTDAIRTPWPLLPHVLPVLVFIILCAWFTAWSASNGKDDRMNLPEQAILTTALTMIGISCLTLLTPILYKLGFGFDGFLHRASEQILLLSGTLHPHPPYYIGQYVFVTWLARVLSLPLRATDILLVPLVTLTIPLALLIAFPKKERAWTVAFLPLVLPLGSLIATTPQSFAYLLGLLALLTALAEDAHPLIPLALAAWSLATHPLAGLPLLGATILLIILQKKRVAYFFPAIVVLLTAASVPLAFFFNRSSGAAVHWNFSALLDWPTYARAFQHLFISPRALSLWPDWAAFVERLTVPALFLAALAGIWKDAERRRAWLWLTALAGLTVVAAFMLKSTGDFSFLIGYERGNYANRLLIIGQLILIPIALTGLAKLAMDASQKSKMRAAIFFLFLAAWQGAQFYLALPRHDAAVVGHGWSVGHADQEAVRWIDRDANGPYIVLADQSVSAAAVEAFGFKRYATDPTNGTQNFFYPIPTGGPLYDVYLRTATRRATRELVGQAARLGQSDRVYMVLNDYWWDADRTDETLTSIADAKKDIGNGEVKIYTFDFSKNKNVSR